MPTRSTLTFACCAASTMATRLSCNSGNGSPRKPSLAPSSSTSTDGWYFCSSAGRRLRPLSDVSPLMLALTAVHIGTILRRRASSSDTQPDSTGMLCAADNESPSTRTVFGVAAMAVPMPHQSIKPLHINQPRHRRMSDSSRLLLEACDVSKSVSGPEGRLDILYNVSLQIRSGESFAIVGAS